MRWFQQAGGLGNRKAGAVHEGPAAAEPMEPRITQPADLLPATPAWLAGCRTGDPRALSAMVQDTLPVVERVIGSMVGRTPDFDDLVQTTFAEAIPALVRFRGDSSFKTWITRIAVKRTLMHLRSGKLRRHAPLESVPEQHTAAPTADLDQALDEARLGARLHALLDRISPAKRIALLLFAVEGQPVEEVAALMGASQTATRSRVFFARRELRALIEADPPLRDLAAALVRPRRRSEP